MSVPELQNLAELAAVPAPSQPNFAAQGMPRTATIGATDLIPPPENTMVSRIRAAVAANSGRR
jgi:hypothetical protein